MTRVSMPMRPVCSKCIVYTHQTQLECARTTSEACLHVSALAQVRASISSLIPANALYASDACLRQCGGMRAHGAHAAVQ